MQRNITPIIMMLAFLLLAGAAMAQDEPVCEPGEGLGQGNGVCQFIDEDGDGFNDLAPDADGDGIPNGLDEDYVRPEDGSGEGAGTMNRFQHMFGKLEEALSKFALKTGTENGHMFGAGDCTGTGDGPADGTGFGPGSADGGNGHGAAGDATGGAGGSGGGSGGGTGGFGGNGQGNGRS